MSGAAQYFELQCPGCGWSEVCGPEAMIGWLRRAGKVRAHAAPELEILHELFRVTAPQLACPRCSKTGLAWSAAEDDWSDDCPCEACGRTIPPERLEAVPGATLCAACQEAEESGRPRTEKEYCPRCGAAMEVRLKKSGGITRYVLCCTANPPCKVRAD